MLLLLFPKAVSAVLSAPMAKLLLPLPVGAAVKSSGHIHEVEIDEAGNVEPEQARQVRRVEGSVDIHAGGADGGRLIE